METNTENSGALRLTRAVEKTAVKGRAAVIGALDGEFTGSRRSGTVSWWGDISTET